MRFLKIEILPRLSIAFLAAMILMASGPNCLAQTESQAPPPDGSPAEEESLDARYARAHLELAKLDLKRAEYWNKRIPNVISKRMIEFMRKHVEVDSEQLRQNRGENYVDVHQIYVRSAKLALEIAEADAARKQRTYKEAGGTFAGLELDRALAAVTVARLNVERTMAQRDSLQSISYLQWQLEELRNQILELQVKVETTPER